VFAFDRRLVTQAVTNLVKNAREAIEPRLTAREIELGQIRVNYGIRNGAPYLSVTDNGIGLPQENRHRLAEPYMTTREKGTGLGSCHRQAHHGGTWRFALPDGFA
jgi:two-component system nitrogen regulation sensor histidine kinase NtrY